MPTQANVSSIDAIATFRARLLVYLTKARPAVEEVSSEIMRTRLWLQNDQRLHWEGQARQRAKKLEQAQHELYSSRIAKLREISTAEQAAVNKAKRALEEAEAKLRTIKIWSRDFDSRVDPLVKQLEKLHTFLAHDMVRATAHLAALLKTLDAYANTGLPAVPGAGGIGQRPLPSDDPPPGTEALPELTPTSIADSSPPNTASREQPDGKGEPPVPPPALPPAPHSHDTATSS
ncbi:hypothetical protein LBMAG56_44310 [Verrucomicrobiota bacterium]|nr:hypothetical protein LBMAG56_44310 [Verrucomicrobiota bacterium]